MKDTRSQRLNSFPVGIFSIVMLATVVSGCMGYVPGRKAEWDQRVDELCKKDGGVTVYERVYLTKEEYTRLGGTNVGLPIPEQRFASPAYPYFREEIQTSIRAGNPAVGRGETVIRRRSDGKVLGRSVQYWRSGGDLPTGLAHESHYICPVHANVSGQIFQIGEGGR